LGAALEMGNAAMEFSGRKFSAEDVELIKSTILMYPKLPQLELASTVCELIGWVQINGNPKTAQCISCLRKLDEIGVITLPPLRKDKAARKPASERKPEDDLSWVDSSSLCECGPIMLEIVQAGGNLQKWRAYMRNYHSLGDPNAYGSQIRYMIKTGNGRDLGCLLFSAASWALAPRDKMIGWTHEGKKERLHLISNNSRFLLFPWVQVKNLASRVLSMAARRIQDDWIVRYGYAPVLLETFVDASMHKGTCYKASNWMFLGETQGRGRNDRQHEHALTQKEIYIFPLQRDFVSVLKGEKPCRSVDYNSF